MKKYTAVSILLCTPALLAGQGTTGQGAGASRIALAQLVVDYWEWRLAEQPELATQVGRDQYNDRWRDWSREARDRARVKRRELLQQAMYLSPGTLTDDERLTAHLMEYELRSVLEAERYLDFVQRVSQQAGAHTQVFTVVDQMPFRTVKDYENLVARLERLPVYVDQTIALLREQIADGLTQPPAVVDRIIEQVAAQRQPAPLESPLLASLHRFPSTIGEADRRRLQAAAVAAYERSFVPSWTRYETFLRDEYRPRARASAAISSVPGGAELYAAAVRFHTTVSMAAEDIHRTGLGEVARLEREMEDITRGQGFTGTIEAFERQLRSRPGARYTSRDEMLAHAREVLSRVEPQLPRFFGRIPRMQVGVRPIPPDREASTASNYTVGTSDGSRQAWFNLNTFRPDQQVRYTMPALVLHETVPGHHLHVALARELPGLADFRRALAATAFSEGWALYAESLGLEMAGVYPDAESRFGRLASERFRAVRLVVDTGLHALGWSREQALDYFARHAPSQSPAEIDRYIAWPGQALAYKIGELKIRELRERAERALGPRFDLRAFHDAVLRSGTLPLEMLEQQVERYIAAGR